jgi:hypothetical protein
MIPVSGWMMLYLVRALREIYERCCAGHITEIWKSFSQILFWFSV